MKAQGQEHYNFALGHCSLVLEHYKLVVVQVVPGHCNLVQGLGHCNLVLVQNSLVMELVLEVHCNWELVVPQELDSLEVERCNLVLVQRQENYSFVLEGNYNLMQVVPVESHIGHLLVGGCSLVRVEHCNWGLKLEHHSLVQEEHCSLGLELVHCNLVQGEQHSLVLVQHGLVQGPGKKGHCSLG